MQEQLLNIHGCGSRKSQVDCILRISLYSYRAVHMTGMEVGAETVLSLPGKFVSLHALIKRPGTCISVSVPKQAAFHWIRQRHCPR